MMKHMEIENKAIVPIHGLKSGGKLKIKVDKNGTPLDQHWRRRLRDNDGAIVFNKSGKKKTAKK